MGGKTIVWCLFVMYFVTADGYVVVLNLPEDNNSEEKNNEIELITLDKNDGSREVMDDNWSSHPVTPVEGDSDTVCDTTEKGYKYFESTRSCYKVHTDRASWAVAEITCVHEGGRLLVVNSRDEANVLVGQYPRKFSAVHVGIILIQGSWKTIDGKSLSEAGYENWYDEEPKYNTGDRYCGSMYNDGSFAVISCSYETAFICEKDPVSLPQPTSTTEPQTTTKHYDYYYDYESESASVQQETSTADRIDSNYDECDATYTDYTLDTPVKSCYKVHKERLIRDDAEAACRREQATLVKIDSLGEAMIIKRLQSDGIMNYVFVGELRGSWPLIFNSKPEEWGPGRQDRFWESSDSETLPCIAMFEELQLTDVPCRFKLPFICEKENFDGHHYSGHSVTTTTEGQLTFDTTEGTSSVQPPPPFDSYTVCGHSDYTYLESTQSCYKVYKYITTWNNAEATCVREGGHLAVVNSQDEADLFKADFPVGSSYQVFLGFHLVGDSWMTIEGQTLSDTGYENWNEGEPNNVNGLQYCGSMYPDGTFDDISCSIKLAFICEKNSIYKNQDTIKPDVNTEVYEDYYDTSKVMEEEKQTDVKQINDDQNSECNTTATGYLYYESTRSCYKVHGDGATWNDAEATCVREGGHLAVVNSQDEADILRVLHDTLPRVTHIFIGFSYRELDSPVTSDMYDIRENGRWLTVDGQTLPEAGYENWTPGEPNNAGGREYCGTIYSNGKFDDSACYNRFAYFCEIHPQFI